MLGAEYGSQGVVCASAVDTADCGMGELGTKVVGADGAAFIDGTNVVGADFGSAKLAVVDVGATSFCPASGVGNCMRCACALGGSSMLAASHNSAIVAARHTAAN